MKIKVKIYIDVSELLDSYCYCEKNLRFIKYACSNAFYEYISRYKFNDYNVVSIQKEGGADSEEDRYIMIISLDVDETNDIPTLMYDDENEEWCIVQDISVYGCSDCKAFLEEDNEYS